jgi:hypothetical protein
MAARSCFVNVVRIAAWASRTHARRFGDGSGADLFAGAFFRGKWIAGINGDAVSGPLGGSGLYGGEPRASRVRGDSVGEREALPRSKKMALRQRGPILIYDTAAGGTA